MTQDAYGGGTATADTVGATGAAAIAAGTPAELISATLDSFTDALLGAGAVRQQAAALEAGTARGALFDTWLTLRGRPAGTARRRHGGLLRHRTGHRRRERHRRAAARPLRRRAGAR